MCNPFPLEFEVHELFINEASNCFLFNFIDIDPCSCWHADMYDYQFQLLNINEVWSDPCGLTNLKTHKGFDSQGETERVRACESVLFSPICNLKLLNDALLSLCYPNTLRWAYCFLYRIIWIMIENITFFSQTPLWFRFSIMQSLKNKKAGKLKSLMTRSWYVTKKILVSGCIISIYSILNWTVSFHQSLCW